jgi:hypothetical protein
MRRREVSVAASGAQQPAMPVIGMRAIADEVIE